MKNKTVNSYNILLEEKAKTEREISNLQREKDLKVDRINKIYEDKIATKQRKSEYLDMQIEQSRDYVNKNK